MVMGAVALGRGIREHGFLMPSAVGGLGLGVMAGAITPPHAGFEPVFTVVGVSTLALGHRLNSDGRRLSLLIACPTRRPGTISQQR